MNRPAPVLAGLLLVAGLAVSWPLPDHWRTGLPIGARGAREGAVLSHGSGDTLQLYYQLWLLRDGLVGPTPLATDPYQFRVNGPRGNLLQTFLPLALPYALLSGVGLLAAYNVLVWLSFPLAGLSLYLLVRRLTQDAWAAATAGIVFALVPARLGPLFGGQPAGFAAALVPMILWGLEVTLAHGRAAAGVVGGLAFLALAALEPHYTYLAAGLGAAYAALRARALRPRPWPWLALGLFAGLAAAGGGWLLLLRQTLLLGSLAEAGRPLDEVRLFSTGPGAFLWPATYGGVVPLALAALGLVAPGRRVERPDARRDERWTRALFGAALGLGLLLSVGPTVPDVPVYPALHRWAPLFGLIRNPEKFRVLASVGGAVLAGYGARGLLGVAAIRRLGAPGPVLAVLVLAATAPWHAIAVTRLPDSAAYPTLAAEARRVLYLPLWPGDSAWSSRYLYHVTRTRVPMVNGYSPLTPRWYVAEVFAPLQGLNVGDLGPAEAALLARLGVTHVVLDRAAFPPQVSPFPSAFTRDRLDAAPALVPAGSGDPLWVYRVRGTAAGIEPPATSPIGVFHEAEALPRETGGLADERTASGGRIAEARTGKARAGFLTFGPYRLLPAGRYRATFRVRGAGLTPEVVTDAGRRTLAAKRLPPTADWQLVTLPFALERAGALELRTRWDGSGDAAADWVSVVFADRPEPEWAFEVEVLPHRLGERRDPTASGGRAGYADTRESLRAPLVSGPSRLYPAGHYRLSLRVRAEASVPGPLVRLTVTEPAGRVLADRLVEGPEIPPGAYREVGLDFSLPDAAVVEFPIWYLGGTGVFFDRLRVTAREG
jgi:hypothetical protein